MFTYPHTSLRKIARMVEFLNPFDMINEDLMRELTQEFKESGGLALAHNQVSNDPLRCFIVDDKFTEYLPKFVFNPWVVNCEKNVLSDDEGCLSFPGIYIAVERPKEIVVSYQTYVGNEERMKLCGEVARMFQHELDHLDGKLIVDHVDRKTRFKIHSELLKRKA
jgi:peptide deformylase